jgi:hypothetical protein
VKGVSGTALRLRRNNLLHFDDFREPVDEKGLLGSMTVSFWMQMNANGKREIRLGRGAGLRYPTSNANWQRSWEANYAGWDISTVGGYSELSFTASYERVGPANVLAPSPYKDGARWSHVVAVYNRKTGKRNVWLNGRKFPGPFEPTRKRKTPPPPGPVETGKLGIISANVPLAVSTMMTTPGSYASFDELCIWDRALTEDEIKTLYNNGHGISLPKDATGK